MKKPAEKGKPGKYINIIRKAGKQEVRKPGNSKSLLF
jgi:hypothetical protein